jgi:thymidine kinase
MDASNARPQLAPAAALTVIAGPMFAGKTTELLRRIAAARDAGLLVAVAKPARDTRYSAAHLVSHTGLRVEAVPVGRAEELLALATRAGDRAISNDAGDAEECAARAARGSGVEVEPRATTSRPIDLLAIDEIHFFAADAVAPIAALRAQGVAVVVAGCDLDHFGEVFAPFDALLPLATEVVRLAGECARCGAPSTHSERLVAATERIIVGGAAEFAATCAACFRPSRR